jgi:hypothetical protein
MLARSALLCSEVPLTVLDGLFFPFFFDDGCFALSDEGLSPGLTKAAFRVDRLRH